MQPFTLAGEAKMSEADKQRIGQIYMGPDWRALAYGGSMRWYAVNNMESEASAVAEVIKTCQRSEQICTLHSIGNFRIGEIGK